jgi:hypothetical protein
MNAGVGNMSLSQIVANRRRHGTHLKKDTVVLVVTPRAPETHAVEKPPGWLLKHSELAALLVTFSQQVTSGALGENQLIEAYRQKWTTGPGAIAMHEAVDALGKMQKEKGFKVILVMIPESHDFNHYRFGFMSEIMAKVAKEKQWEFLDVLPLLQGPPSTDYWVSTQDLHLNGKANGLIADQLLRYL